MDAFQYEPLDRHRDRLMLRRLELLPGTGQIHCNLEHVSLTQKPQYEAISYCWGSNKSPREIICNGSKMEITESLHSALVHFRKLDLSRFLWADQLCINQKDDDERGFQVGFMREIYENADQTLIWLGSRDPDQKHDDPERAFALLKRLAVAHERRRACTPPDKRTIFELSRAEIADFGLPEVVTDKIWQSVRLIWSRPWFYRLWVIQEVAVSKRIIVHCGHSPNSEINWPDIVAAAACAFELGVFYVVGNYSSFGASIEIMRKQRLGGNATSLTSMLIEFSHYQATESKDKVFALVGLASELDRKIIVPDYNLTVESVYLNTTVSILERSRNLDILCAVNKCFDGEVEARGLGLPSWIRDYSDSATPMALCLMPEHNISNRPRTERGPRFRAANVS